MIRTAIAASLLAGSALAQVGSPLTIAQGLLQLASPQCQNTVYSLANSSSPQYQCLRVDKLLPAILTNGSIIEPVDEYLSTVCYSPACNSTLLNSTAQAIVNGCSAELGQLGVDNKTVYEIVNLYPLAREVACLKDKDAKGLKNATIPLNSTSYNTTNGTFCVTELATNITGYLDVNLTNSYVDTLILGGNYSALRALESIPPTALCSNCIYAAYDLIEAEIPKFGGLVVDNKNNVTIEGFLNKTCVAEGFNATTNGTLPNGIIPVANGTNSTTHNGSSAGRFTSAISSAASASSTASRSAASGTSAAASGASSAASRVASGASAATSSAGSALAGRMAEKRRWVGEQ
ncbi:hypothetical protein DB88DRAFT_24159 [Papiliotrema laurentii]|uniref:Uncharacterized protein n=1 Tax=Papiliotrema laurentii TaxID=5418 RepID=A0AAD9L8L4_PAPLA|nr:hypothetical protein DB88DRAFT_24159 [Papiliotrema laurentii]